jgi:hypothetical protein
MDERITLLTVYIRNCVFCDILKRPAPLRKPVLKTLGIFAGIQIQNYVFRKSQ